MKLFIVTSLLGILLFGLLMALDFIMGVNLKGIIMKELDPFRVMETAEYVILLMFILFFIFDAIRAYLNKKKGGNQPSN